MDDQKRWELGGSLIVGIGAALARLFGASAKRGAREDLYARLQKDVVSVRADLDDLQRQGDIDHETIRDHGRRLVRVEISVDRLEQLEPELEGLHDSIGRILAGLRDKRQRDQSIGLE